MAITWDLRLLLIDCKHSRSKVDGQLTKILLDLHNKKYKNKIQFSKLTNNSQTNKNGQNIWTDVLPVKMEARQIST